MHYELSAKICTTENVLVPEILKGIESILDESGLTDVKKIGFDDPPRRKITSFQGELTKLFLEESDLNEPFAYLMTNSGRVGRFSCYWQIRTKATRIYRDIRGNLEGMGVDTNYSELLFRLQSARIELSEVKKFSELIIGVARLTNAFYGRCTDQSMMTQFLDLFNGDKGIFETRRAFPTWDRVLEDVCWLNYFGPGFTEFWGKAKVKQLLSAYNEVLEYKDGAFLIQTTPVPAKADPSMKRVIDYPWKKPFYDILGYNTFMHETYVEGEPGQYVPTIDMHRKYNNDPVK